jgi:hypothetical protein
MLNIDNFNRSSIFSSTLTYIGRLGRLAIMVALSLPGLGYAVLPFNVTTNADRTINNGSWTGNGTIQANLNPGTFSVNGLKKDVLIDDFSLGTFSINPGALRPQPRVLSDVGVSISVEIVGGTADFILVNSTQYDDGDRMYNSVGLTNFQGAVTEIIWTVGYTIPIAARSDAIDVDGNGNNVINRPLGAGIGLVTAGSGLSINSFNVALDFGGVYSTPTASGQFSGGIPTGALAQASPGWDNNRPGTTSFVSADGFTGTVVLGQSSPHFLMVRGYDYAGQDGYNKDADSPLTYINYLTYRITTDPGLTFSANTEFTMSLDGQQFSNVGNVPVDPIPEPSSLVLAGVAFMTAVLRRRRPRR